MRYRPLDQNGDYTTGVPWLVDSPECVEQAIQTRLNLWRREWFLDTSDGTDYFGEVLGERPERDPDQEVQQRILGTPGVTSISAYSATYDGNARAYNITATVETQYGQVQLSTAVPVPAVP